MAVKIVRWTECLSKHELVLDCELGTIQLNMRVDSDEIPIRDTAKAVAKALLMEGYSGIDSL